MSFMVAFRFSLTGDTAGQQVLQNGRNARTLTVRGPQPFGADRKARHYLRGNDAVTALENNGVVLAAASVDTGEPSRDVNVPYFENARFLVAHHPADRATPAILRRDKLHRQIGCRREA